MIAMQSAAYTFGDSKQESSLQILLDVELEVPSSELGVDVSTEFLFDSDSPGLFEGLIYQSASNGVHSGLAIAEYPLPDNGIVIRITKLSITPAITEASNEATVVPIAAMLNKLVAGIVASLWNSLATLK